MFKKWVNARPTKCKRLFGQKFWDGPGGQLKFPGLQANKTSSTECSSLEILHSTFFDNLVPICPRKSSWIIHLAETGIASPKGSSGTSLRLSLSLRSYYVLALWRKKTLGLTARRRGKSQVRKLN